MSDETGAQGSQPSWTPPPPGNPTPPPPPQQETQVYRGSPAPDPTGGTPPPRARSGPNVNVSPALVLGVVSIIAILIGLLLKVDDKVGTGVADAEGDVKLWDTMGWTWSWLAVVAAVLTVLPAVRGVVNISESLSRTITTIAAGALVFWWVLFVLPHIGLTTGFLATVGVAAGVGAVWLSRESPPAGT